MDKKALSVVQYILLIIIIGTIFLIGYLGVKSILERREEMRFQDFRQKLTNKIAETYPEFEYEQQLNSINPLLLPGKYTDICIFDKKKKPIADCEKILNKVFCDSWKDNSDNVILLGKGKKIRTFSLNKITLDTNTDGVENDPEGYLCIKDRDGRIDLRIIGKGDHAFISPLPNKRPRITKAIAEKAVEEIPYTNKIEAVDPDKDKIYFTLIDGPEGLSIDDKGVINWIPTNIQAARFHKVGLEISDGYSKERISMDIFVENTNDMPYFISQPNLTAVEDSPYYYLLRGNDDDLLNPSGESLSFEIVEGKGEIKRLNETSSLLVWVPDNEDSLAGDVHFSILLKDSFGGNITQNFTVAVRNTNDPPVCSFELLELEEDSVLDVNLSDYCSDEDLDILNYSAISSDLDISIAEDNMSITPKPDWNGYSKINLTVDDKSVIVDYVVDVYVFPANDPPELSSIGNKVIDEGVLLDFSISAADKDIQKVSYSVENLPAGAKFIKGLGLFVWRPSKDTVPPPPYGQNLGQKAFNLTFIASDGLEDTRESINITVFNKNSPPEITAAHLELTSNRVRCIVDRYNDPDGDPVNFTFAFSKDSNFNNEECKETTSSASKDCDQFNPLDKVFCEIIPSDYAMDGNPVIVTVPSLSPFVGYIDTEFKCNAQGLSVNANNYEYNFTLDGVSLQSGSSDTYQCNKNNCIRGKRMQCIARASDGSSWTPWASSNKVPIMNRLPSITEFITDSPTNNPKFGENYFTANVTAVDDDNDPLNYSFRWKKKQDSTWNLWTQPSPMKDITLGFFSKGEYEIEVNLSDGFDSIKQTISFKLINNPPVINMENEIAIDEGELFNFYFNSTDRDKEQGTAAIISCEPSADCGKLNYGAGLSVHSFSKETSTYLLSFNPSLDTTDRSSSPKVFKLNITVSDGDNGLDSKILTVKVLDKNRPPVITRAEMTYGPIPSGFGGSFFLNNFAKENHTSTITVEASDPDGDPVNISFICTNPDCSSAVSLDNKQEPAFTYNFTPDFEFVKHTNNQPTINGKPHTLDSYMITINATDGYGGEATKDITITVEDTNRRPYRPSKVGEGSPQLFNDIFELPLSTESGKPIQFRLFSNASIPSDPDRDKVDGRFKLLDLGIESPLVNVDGKGRFEYLFPSDTFTACTTDEAYAILNDDIYDSEKSKKITIKTIKPLSFKDTVKFGLKGKESNTKIDQLYYQSCGEGYTILLKNYLNNPLSDTVAYSAKLLQVHIGGGVPPAITQEYGPLPSDITIDKNTGNIEITVGCSLVNLLGGKCDSNPLGSCAANPPSINIDINLSITAEGSCGKTINRSVLLSISDFIT